MNTNIIKKLLNISFTSLGILILLWTFLWFIKLKTATDLGTLLIGIIFLSAGIYIMLIFIGLIIAYLIIRFIIKKIKKQIKNKK
jgi:positive regulator of sigma E activity